MRPSLCSRRSGQVLIMVTLVLLAMCGLMGLVVDLGWSHYVRKSQQAAADAAALAAVKEAMDLAAATGNYSCTGGAVQCAPAPVDCPGATGNLASACLYAQNHGFVTNTRQHVTVQASDRTTAPTVIEGCGQEGATIHRPPTAGCVDTWYWVTVRVWERVPQLFSAVLGNFEGQVSARATAAVAKAEHPAALILLNRENDPWNPSGNPQPPGIDLYVGGTPTVIVPGGIALSSTAHGPGNQDPWAGLISGQGTVEAPFTYIRTGGAAKYPSGNWTAEPQGADDGELFYDPYRNVVAPGVGGQPPLTTNTLNAIPVLNGELTSAICNPACGSGNYFAVREESCGGGCTRQIATGDQLTIRSDVTFNSGNFGEFHLFGGLNIGQARVTFGPGRYVFAGVRDPVRTPLLNTDNRADISSGGSNGSDAGRIFILTDSQYTAQNELARQVTAIDNYLATQNGGYRDWPGLNNTLLFARSSVKAGNNANSRTELFGLNERSGSLPSELEKFAASPVQNQGAGVVIWQDQRNSYVKYTADGQVDTISCLGGTINNPCYNTYPAPPSDSPQLELWATPYAKYEGVIYQPRGAWTVLQASGTHDGAMRIVSGALKTQGSGVLTMNGNSPPIMSFVPALVE